MSKISIVTLSVFGLVSFFVVSLVLGYIGFVNDARQFENGIVAAYTNNQNVYDNGWKTVKEKAQVPDAYTGKLKELYTATMEGRYGEKGSGAMFQFINEQNPQLPPAIYEQVEQSVEIFHNQFTQAQTDLVARKNSYLNFLTGTTSGRFYNMLGHFPHLDMSKYDIVTSDKTQQDFGTKKAPELTVFK